MCVKCHTKIKKLFFFFLVVADKPAITSRETSETSHNTKNNISRGNNAGICFGDRSNFSGFLFVESLLRIVVFSSIFIILPPGGANVGHFQSVIVGLNI